MLLRAIVAALVCGAGLAEAQASAPPGGDSPEGIEFFESRVRPMLIDHCYSCHSAEAKKVRGDLWLDSKAGWQKGGSSGKPAIVPGNPDASPLVVAIRYADPDLAMPPKERLSSNQVAILEAWVRMGAPDPRTGTQPVPGPADSAKTHWAFQPVQEPPLPTVTRKDWVRNGIDRFILAELEKNGLTPAPQADRRTLLRRASFVLTGLAPSLGEIAAFESNPDPDAFERAVDRLLASPRYGERWGRHWLDVARYADTKGYVFEEERSYPYAYTYRDYVIRALNEDKPYDRFLIEQIAADQLDQGSDSTALAAMGFLTLGRRFLNNPHDIIDDRIDTLTRGTMALTVACARCHDHKYDPIPAADYYSLYGVFASSEEPAEKPLLGTIPDPVLYQEFQAELQRRKEERDTFVSQKEAEYRTRLRETVGDYLLAAHDAKSLPAEKREELARSRKLSPMVLERWISALETYRQKPEPIFAAWLTLEALPEEGFVQKAEVVAKEIAANAGGHHEEAIAALFVEAPPPTLQDAAQRYSKLFASGSAPVIQKYLATTGIPVDLTPSELHQLFDVPEGQKMRALQRKIDELNAVHPGAPPRAMALADRPQPVEPSIFKRGNPGNPGPQVPRQFLGLLVGPDRRPFSHGSGRLELAQAIASPDNPLTARVAVNRVWIQHFGGGLVRTSGDFGTRCDPPTHPELLDWLATKFVREGWSLKKLHRWILTSATWQQASEATALALEKDPDNRWLSHQNRRRLDFEAMRDVLLEAGGDLDLRMGGHSVDITGRSYAKRRSVYGFIERQNLPAMFRTFDFATPDTTSSQRFTTTVPQQALFFLNSPFALDQTRYFASRKEVSSQHLAEARISRLYEILYQREPNPRETELARQFLQRKEDKNPRFEAPVWQYGYGNFDAEKGSVTIFKPLPHFTGSAWQGGRQLPDTSLGWVILNAEGGHPGGLAHGPVIRRWTAPQDAVIEITGTLTHQADAGDGIRATIVTSRPGVLGQWRVRKNSVETRIEKLQVTRGDTIDFIVDCQDNENSDSFGWAPRIQTIPAQSGEIATVWDARGDFAGPPEPATHLSSWERYAQVLLMANETVFVD